MFYASVLDLQIVVVNLTQFQCHLLSTTEWVCFKSCFACSETLLDLQTPNGGSKKVLTSWAFLFRVNIHFSIVTPVWDAINYNFQAILTFNIYHIKMKHPQEYSGVFFKCGGYLGCQCLGVCHPPFRLYTTAS